MPNKRSRHKNTQHFSCPYCQNRLWRLGSEKYYLFCQDIADLKKALNCSPKKAKLVMSHHPNYLDHNSWIEEFLCDKDGLMWLLVVRQPDGKLRSVLAKENDWKRTNKTIDPRTPNPSVSEYTYRMSRGT